MVSWSRAMRQGMQGEMKCGWNPNYLMYESFTGVCVSVLCMLLKLLNWGEHTG